MPLEEMCGAIEEQLNSEQTPYVREHFERLCALEDEDLDEKEVRRMMAFCLLDELEAMGREGRGFDEGRYRRMLEFLPILPERR